MKGSVLVRSLLTPWDDFQSTCGGLNRGAFERFRIDLPCHDLSLLSPASRRWLLELLEIWRPITPTTRSAFLNDRTVRRKSHMRWKIPIYPRWVIPKMNQKWEIELNYLTAPWLSESWENPVSRPLIENLLPSFSYQSLPDLSSTFDPIRGCHCASRWFAASVDFSIVQHDLQESTWAHPSKIHKETPLLPASYRFPCVKWNAPEALCLTSQKMMSGFRSLPLHIWKVIHLKIPPHPAYQCKA